MKVKNWPMNFKGTLKRITPEDAKKMFNYDMPLDAKGITFKVRNKKNIMVPYYPEKYVNDNFTKNSQFTSSKNIMTVLIKIAPQIKDILYPVWHAEAIKKGFYSGHHFFISTNFQRMQELPNRQQCLENILFTIGTLPPPGIGNRESLIGNRKEKTNNGDSILKLKMEKVHAGYQTGVVLLDTETLQVKHIPPQHYPDAIEIPLKKKQLAFIYYKKGEVYSPSVRFFGGKDAKNRKN